MDAYSRKNGISVLVACQNEEATLALCLQSFLDFADEIILVDNGSTDSSKEIAKEIQSRFPNKIQYYYVPDLLDLYHNRQYALEKSTYRWVVRADADFITYTDGEFNILQFREELLRKKRSIFPKVYAAPLPNVTCDFWHAGIEHTHGRLGPRDPGRYVPPPVTHPTLRIYEVFPGFKFKRFGRWEATTFHRLLWWQRVDLDKPLWMHCTLKSSRSFLFRSERTNWREQGDFKRYPTLETYLNEIIQEKYGTVDIDEASELFMQNDVYPFLQRYDPAKYYAYPRLIAEQMVRNPIYKILEVNGKIEREHHGIDPMPY